MSFQVAVLFTFLIIANTQSSTPMKKALSKDHKTGCIAVAMAADAHKNGTQDDAPRRQNRCAPHPCTQVSTNQTIETTEGRVMCIVPSERELMQQLKAEGTYNARYMAVNEEQASAFPSLLDVVKPSTPPSTILHSSTLPKTPLSTASRGTTQPTTKITTPPTKPLVTVQPDGFWWWARGKRSVDNKQLQETLSDSVEKIRCSKKGSRTKYGMRKICTECQQATQLPVGHFPEFLNEVVCGDETSNGNEPIRDSCYEDYGECIQNNLYLRLLKRSNDLEDVTAAFRLQLRLFSARKALKQVYRPYGREVKSCCECQIYG